MTSPAEAIGLRQVYRARKAIQGLARRTELRPSPALSDLAGGPVSLKLEVQQPIGAFKLRGAANAVSRLAPGTPGVACCSTGNHGRAVAYAARAAGLRAVVCLSSLVPEVKVRAIEALGAEVRRVGRSQDEAQLEVDRLVRDDGLVDLPPFDHPDVIAGQATIALECLEDLPELATLVVPLSGGGLIGGIALAAKSVDASIRVVGVTMERGAAMAESLRAGGPVEVEELPSLADSLGGGIGVENRWTFRLCRELLDDVILVSESEIYRAMAWLFREERLVTEGGAAVGVAALLAGRLGPLSGPAVFVVSGQNVDMEAFSAIVTGRPVRLGELVVAGEEA